MKTFQTIVSTYDVSISNSVRSLFFLGRTIRVYISSEFTELQSLAIMPQQEVQDMMLPFTYT
jgi:hypothetical protein